MQRKRWSVYCVHIEGVGHVLDFLFILARTLLPVLLLHAVEIYNACIEV